MKKLSFLVLPILISACSSSKSYYRSDVFKSTTTTFHQASHRKFHSDPEKVISMFDMNGKKLSLSAQSHLAPGIYFKLIQKDNRLFLEKELRID